jgi:hypothetical protein
LPQRELSEMYRAESFHPEWGCLATAPGFIRTARVAVLATTIGATVSAGVVFSLLTYPTTESAVSARTLVRPVQTASEPPGEERKKQALNRPRVDANQLADAVTARATTKALEGFGVAATAAMATGDTLAKKAAASPVALVGAPARHPTKTKSTEKRDVTSQGKYREAEAFGRQSQRRKSERLQGTTSPQGSPEVFLLGLRGVVTRLFGQSSP